jgi:hypothetical protein
VQVEQEEEEEVPVAVEALAEVAADSVAVEVALEEVAV